MFVRIKGRVHYNIRSMFLSTKNKSVMCHVTNNYKRGKTKVSYYIILRETQKYQITSRSSKLLKTAFSCGLCYSNRRIVLSYYEKRKVIFFQEQKGEYITILSTNNKSVMLQIFTL